MYALTELIAHALVSLLVEESSEIGNWVLVHGQALHEMLVVHADAQARVAAHLALGGHELVCDQLDDRTARRRQRRRVKR